MTPRTATKSPKGQPRDEAPGPEVFRGDDGGGRAMGGGEHDVGGDERAGAHAAGLEAGHVEPADGLPFADVGAGDGRQVGLGCERVAEQQEQEQEAGQAGGP